MKKPTRLELLKQYYDMQWEADFRTAHGDIARAFEAVKEMFRIQDLLWELPAVNTFRA